MFYGCFPYSIEQDLEVGTVMYNFGEKRQIASDESTKPNLKSNRPKRTPPFSPLGTLIQEAMHSLGLSYQQIVSQSNRLASLSNNREMRIGKSTLGNIISGTIRQPSTAKLDSLRILLHLRRDQLDVAIGLAPERRFIEQLKLKSDRTHEITHDAVTRHRIIKIPIISEDAKLARTQFLNGVIERWATLEVEFLSSFYPPYLRYFVIGEGDTHASPIAPPGTRVLVNTLITEIRDAENVSFHERELYCVLTQIGLTCTFLERGSVGKTILVPHPFSGGVREEVDANDLSIVGIVVGLLRPVSVER
jgi:hypothetical protein